MSEIINETINELNKPTQNNVFSIEDDPVTVLEKINQVERYLKQIDSRVDTSINTANEALEKANNAFEANGTLVKINGENQLTWSADFAESERQKSKNLLDINKAEFKGESSTYSTLSGGTITINAGNAFCYISSLTNLCNLKPNIPYTLSYVTNNGNSYIYQYIEGSTGFAWNNGETKTFTQAELDRIGNNLLLLYGSTDSTVTYSNIQIEEGSTSTDYQPYNGAIVHEKEIVDIEHINVVYDKSSSNSAINWGYTDGLKANGQVEGVLTITPPVALKTTSKYRVYVNWGGDINIFTASVNHSGTIISGCSATWSYLLYASQLQMCEFQYLSNINQIQFRFRNLTPGGASVEIQTSEYVYITKIEEIS